METNIQKSSEPLSRGKSLIFVALAAVCFHAAYSSLKFPAAGLFIFGFAYFLVRLTDQPSVRRAFYFGLVTGYLCYAPQTLFMWSIFGPLAPILWLVLAFWVGLFAAIVCGAIRRWGKARAMWLVPMVWTGVEYFRSELYYLKFSWLNFGYVSSAGSILFGMYGFGLFVFAIVEVCMSRKSIDDFLRKKIKLTFLKVLAIAAIILILLAMFLPALAKTKSRLPTTASLVGIQMEFPSEGVLPKVLNQALAKNTNAQILF